MHADIVVERPYALGKQTGYLVRATKLGYRLSSLQDSGIFVAQGSQQSRHGTGVVCKHQNTHQLAAAAGHHLQLCVLCCMYVTKPAVGNCVI